MVLSAERLAAGEAVTSCAATVEVARRTRAAAADLIATGDRLTAAFRALGLDSSLTNRSRLAREYEESMVAFDAALARVKGGAA
ncbi:hypothetical protein [Stenotrophomonas maltophilia]|uniref:hypothetical protein n=1 Tax=Stenotrophomonas maltophilia TaxID=40324 RepID=UPI00021E0D54|nr:hypothetical protein [Stenotrophomonas maltophilia]AEM51105.1 hypothetical protein BurJV3_1779 [Stenotrophomonas maltophilia JV3]